MIIIDLGVVNAAKQALIDDRFDRAELAGEAALETNAGLDVRGLHRLLNFEAIFPIQRQGLFNDKMLSRLSRGDGVLLVVLRITADGNDLNARVRQHRSEIVVTANLPAMTQAGLGGVQFARRINRSDLSVSGGIDGGNMRTSDPAITD